MPESDLPEAAGRAELLLEVARVEFQQRSHQSDAIESKAQTYLTVNSLMLTAGVLAVTAGGLPEDASQGATVVVVILSVILLGLLGASYFGLLSVLSVRTTKGVPRSRSVLQNCAGDSPDVLREKLAKYYSDRAELNAETVTGMAETLERSTEFTRYSLIVFFATIVTMLTTIPTLSGDQASPTSMESLNGGGSGDESPPPPPDDIEETTVKKGGSGK